MTQTRGPEQVRQREDLILGNPQRISPPTEITEEMRALAAPPPGYGRPGELPEIFAIMLHAPEMLRHYTALSTCLLAGGKLAPRDRELAILRMGWLCQAPYEWGEHVKIGKKAGLTTQEIECLREGSTAPGWSPHDRAIVQAVEELFADAMISNATWDVLAKTLDARQLVELPILIGHYQGLAYFLNSVRIRLREGNPGLSAG